MGGETWQATNQFRWVDRKTAVPKGEVALWEKHGGVRWVLQQAWQNMNTGAVEWGDIPVGSEHD